MTIKSRWMVTVVGLVERLEVDLMAPPQKDDQILIKAGESIITAQVVFRTIYERGTHPDTQSDRAGVLHCVLNDG